jgi:hypothetical protein
MNYGRKLRALWAAIPFAIRDGLINGLLVVLMGVATLAPGAVVYFDK